MQFERIVTAKMRGIGVEASARRIQAFLAVRVLSKVTISLADSAHSHFKNRKVVRIIRTETFHAEYLFCLHIH